MKFCQIGLGSMGTRRIRNLLFHHVSPHEIVGFDLQAERRTAAEQEYQIQTFDSFAAANETKPDVYLISTPPHLHALYFLYAAKHKKHFFVEVASTDDGYQELLPLLKNADFVAAPSCNFRFFSPIKTLKKLVDDKKIGTIHAFTYHMGQYLPDWHPWEDYRKFYVSKPKSSACREMVPFELSWLQWLLKLNFTIARATVSKCSTLELQIPDVYAISLECKTPPVVGTMLVDIISRSPLRTLRLIGSNGVIEWDWMSKKISVFQSTTKKWHSLQLDNGKRLKAYTATTENMYQEEIGAFLDAIRQKKAYPYTFEDDQHQFVLLKQLEKSSKYFSN